MALKDQSGMVKDQTRKICGNKSKSDDVQISGIQWLQLSVYQDWKEGDEDLHRLQASGPASLSKSCWNLKTIDVAPTDILQ
jgi:hypothetical protein